jgi:hypothetical protein
MKKKAVLALYSINWHYNVKTQKHGISVHPKDPNDIVRTTLYIPRHLYEETKIMAVLTQRGLSEFIRICIKDKLRELKGSR